MHEITSITSGQKGDLEGIQLFDAVSWYVLLKFFVFSKRGSNRAKTAITANNYGSIF